MSPLILNMVGIPLSLGLGLGLAMVLLAPRPWLQTILVGVAFLVIYAVLEGVPAFPPVSGKQRLFYLLLGAIPTALLAATPSFSAFGRAITPLFNAVAVLWLGWTKLMQPGAWPAGLLLLAPVAASLFATPSKPAPEFAWPAALLVYAVGAAILSLLGVFVGFAQMLGAMAALIGGIGLVAYVAAQLFGRRFGLAPSMLSLAYLCVVSSATMIGLYSPEISLAAYATLALVLCTPAIMPTFGNVPNYLRPFLFGLIAAVPATLSITMAMLLAK